MTKVVTDQDGFAEAVLLFDAEFSSIELELHAADFEAMVAGQTSLEHFAASLVNGVFAVVGAALSVSSMVFFTFRVDEEGTVDPNFNLPLRYLADNAGPGPDLGAGIVRLACRGQCPVPWHAVNLWEPITDSENGSIQIVQKAIWRNRLGLRPSAGIDRVLSDTLELNENHHIDEIENRQVLESRLTETFGDEGKVNLENLIRQYNDRVTQVSDKYRTEMQVQQQGYLDQIRSCREEIQELKAALRNEQQRSRRLQELLRGEP